MSKLLKGNAVYGATSYKLFTKSGDSYMLIDTVEEKNIVVKNTFGNKGYIDNSGNIVSGTNASYEKFHSDMFNINELANGPGGYCVGAFDEQYTEYPKICFFADNTLGSFIKGVFVNEIGGTITAEQIRAYANGAKYVIFNSDTEETTESGEDVVYTYKGFEFDLEKYEFPSGTNYLVVKAIGEGGVDINGDGKIYTDSDYGGDVNGNPLEYVVSISAPTATTWYVDDCDLYGETAEKSANVIYYGFGLGEAANALIANKVVNAIKVNFSSSSGTLSVYKLEADDTTTLIKGFTIAKSGIQTLKFDSDITIRSGESIVVGDLEDTAMIKFTAANGTGFYVKVPSAKQAYDGSPCVSVGYVVE